MRTNSPFKDGLDELVDRVKVRPAGTGRCRRQWSGNLLIAVGVLLAGLGIVVLALSLLLALAPWLVLLGLIVMAVGWIKRRLARRRAGGSTAVQDSPRCWWQ